METFAIRHTFPNGETLGDGLMTSGSSYPPPVKRYYSREEAESVAESMRSHSFNEGHSFEVVPYPV